MKFDHSHRAHIDQLFQALVLENHKKAHNFQNVLH